MSWNAIAYVTSGITLIAFIATYLAMAHRRILKNAETELTLAPKNKRAEIIGLRNGVLFNIDTSKLTATQQFKLAMAQIKIARKKDENRLRYGLFFVLVFSAVTVIAFLVPEPVPIEEASIDLSIGNPNQLRFWLEYYDGNNEFRERETRLNGPSGALITMGVISSSVPAQPIIFDNARLTFSLKGPEPFSVIFEPVLVADVFAGDPEKRTWWNRTGDFQITSVTAGENWVHQVGFRANQIQYSSLIGKLRDQSFSNAEFDLALVYSNKIIAETSCKIDLETIQAQITEQDASKGKIPNFVEFNCESV